MEIFAPITKVDATQRLVYGVMAEESPDKSGEIFDYTSSKPHIREWSDDAAAKTAAAGQEISYGNVRAQHNPQIVAGKLTDLKFDDAGKRVLIVAKITNDKEWENVEQGVYTGFSLGGKYVKRWPDGGNVRYTAKPNEVSIVDNQCAKGAKFTLIKADGTAEEHHFHLDLGTLNERIAELAKLVDSQTARQKRVELGQADIEGGLRKALGNPMTGATLEKAQARSPRFVTRGPQPCNASDPWL